MLSGSCRNLAAAAAQALGNLTGKSEECIQAVFAVPNSIKTVVKVLHSSRQELLEYAVELLDNLAAQDSYHAAIIAAGAVPLLIRQLKSSNAYVQLTAARNLGLLAATDTAAISPNVLLQAAAAAAKGPRPYS